METCCHLDFIEKPPANAGVKKTQIIKTITIIITVQGKTLKGVNNIDNNN